MTRSRIDSPTTALGNSGYQSAGERFDVRISDRPGRPSRSHSSSYRSSAWVGVNSRIAKSSTIRTAVLARLRMRAWKLRSACPPASSASSREQVVNVTSYPRRQAWWPRPWARWLLPDSDRAVGDDPLAGRDELQPGQVTDLGGGQRRVVGKVEALQGGLGREAGGLDPPRDLAGLAAGQLVLAQDLERSEEHTSELQSRPHRVC